jgi:transcriptional regulator with PAS, ATPase and Fis domain
MDIQSIKQRFGIIGNSAGLNRAMDIARQVAPTDLSVLITGESGTGKEVFPQIVHQFSARKHGPYIAVNCGAIPEGTIDSELFGHEKGSFTGATDSRQGYFEVAKGGTIFLDEVAELPLGTQVRLLRVLETGEFIRVGSSKVLKTNVRVVAATNVNLPEAIQEGKFREDLYYRLNTVPIHIPALRERPEDIPLLFRKFAVDFAEKYRMPAIALDDEARRMLVNYKWPGNVRQLKNVTEQISVIEQSRLVTPDVLIRYLPDYNPTKLPALLKKGVIDEQTFASEREILYKILFDMRNDVNDLKRLVHGLINGGVERLDPQGDNARLIQNLYNGSEAIITKPSVQVDTKPFAQTQTDIQDTEEIVEESLSISDKEVELIRKALDRHKGRRKLAAQELGISERTLYRKIKEYNLE